MARSIGGILVAGSEAVDEGEARLDGALRPGVSGLEHGGGRVLIESRGAACGRHRRGGEDGGAVAELVHHLDAEIVGVMGVRFRFQAQSRGVEVLRRGETEGRGDAGARS